MCQNRPHLRGKHHLGCFSMNATFQKRLVETPRSLYTYRKSHWVACRGAFARDAALKMSWCHFSSGRPLIPVDASQLYAPLLHARCDRSNVAAENGEFTILRACVVFPTNARSNNGRRSAPSSSAVRSMAVGYSQPALCNRRINVTLHMLPAI